MYFFSFIRKTKKQFIIFLLALPLICQAQSIDTHSIISGIEAAESIGVLEDYIQQANQVSGSSQSDGQIVYEAILSRARKLGNGSLANRALTRLGANLFDQGKYDSAIVVLDGWKFSDASHPAPFELLERNFYKAVAHYYLGEYQTAVELFLSTVNEPALTNNPKFHGRYLRVLGEVYRAADNLDPALEYLQTALEIAEENQDSVGIAASLNRLGVVYYQTAEHEISEKLLQRSLEVSIAASVTSVISSNFNDLGELYFATEEYEKCLNLYEQALDYAQDNDGKINTLNNISRLDWKLGRYNEAIAQAKQALQLAEESNILTYKVDATKIIADSYQELGKFSEATFFYKEYINFRETLFEEEQRRQIIELETQYKTAQKEQEIESLVEREALERDRKTTYLIGLIAVILLMGVLLLLFFQIRKNNSKISSQNDKLEELNNTKDKFFSIIAHDLRSPMIALQGVGQKLEYYIRKDRQDKLLEMGGKIDESIHNLNTLLNNLLNWATSQSGGVPHHPEKLSLRSMVEENIQLFDSLADSKNIQLVNVVENCSIYADQNTASTVIRNIISNAIKFSPEGEIIMLATTETEDCIDLTITDNGTGMSQERIKGIFTQSVKGQLGTGGEKGFGLGLRLCAEFMQRNHGSLNIESEKGMGTKVILSFPRRAPTILRKPA
ncbi:tetratricopeptide repeat protein [Roseivirga sp.]|uniref:tetratricopeptide repeat protein n=1 Tax=Roseivirga sp. TaxID=1964215 RepID=UPI003B52F780